MSTATTRGKELWPESYLPTNVLIFYKCEKWGPSWTGLDMARLLVPVIL